IDFAAQVSRRVRIRLSPPDPRLRKPDEMVSGRVFDETGAPIEGAQVSPMASGSAGDGPVIPPDSTTSDSQGRFEFRSFAGLTYRIVASRYPYSTEEVQHISSGQRDVEIRLKRGGRIEGNVRGADGRAIV